LGLAFSEKSNHDNGANTENDMPKTKQKIEYRVSPLLVRPDMPVRSAFDQRDASFSRALEQIDQLVGA
jgi:hypothetical protein